MATTGNRKVALIAPPKRECALPPLGPALLAGMLQASGIEAVALDADHLAYDYFSSHYPEFTLAYLPDPLGYSERFELLASCCFFKSSHPEFTAALATRAGIQIVDIALLEAFWHHWLADLQCRGFTDLGISVHWFNFLSGMLIARIARVSGLRVLVGGPQVNYPEVQAWLERHRGKVIDEYFTGYCEEKLPNYFGAAVQWGPPDFSALDRRRYLMPRIPVHISRGCRHNACRYCNSQAFPGRFRQSTPDFVLSCIGASVVDGVKAFNFASSDCLDGAETASILTAIRDTYPDITWDGQTRIDRLSDDLVELCNDSGCVRLFFGIEAVTDGLLKKMNKGYSAAFALNRLEYLVNNAGFPIAYNLIFGFPTETTLDLQETAATIQRHPHLFTRRVDGIRGFDLVLHSWVYDQPHRFGIRIGPGHQAHWYPADSGLPSYHYAWRHLQTPKDLVEKARLRQEIEELIDGFNPYYRPLGGEE